MGAGTVSMPRGGKARRGGAAVSTRENVRVGYATFTQDGTSVRWLYNPARADGGTIKVVSQVPRATGSWRITRLSHSLSAYKPGGSWESRIEASFMPGERKEKNAETAKENK